MRTNRFLVGVLCAVLSVVEAAALTNPAEASDAASSEAAADRIAGLVGAMTLEEKVAQLRPMARRMEMVDDSGQLSPEAAAALANGTGYVGRASMRHDPMTAAHNVNAIQRFLVTRTRLGIPALMTEEALHGFMAQGATSFPQALALACTWDVDLVERVFTGAAGEMRARGATWALSPVLDVARDPRWGRTEETYGEDPYLAAALGVAAIRGLQGRGPGIDAHHVLATAKHFAAHGQPEGGTNAAPANISRRIILEQLLLPFAAAVQEAGVGSVMASYNEVDGIPVHVNTWLLQEVLRQQWGFRGMVCSDGGGVGDLVRRHHIAVDEADAAAQAFLAGVDLELDATFGSLIGHVKTSRVPMTRLDEAVTHVLQAKQALGLFDDPYVDPEQAAELTNTAELRALALEAASKAVVLLKNDGVLPLDLEKVRSLAVIGPNAEDLHVGGYSHDPAPGISVLDGVRQVLGEQVKVTSAKGCHITTGVQGWRGWWEDEVALPDPETETGLIVEAAEVAAAADVVLLVVGENESVCREGWSREHLGDRDNLKLPGRQAELVEAVVATGTPTVLLLINGRPLAITELVPKVDAILEGFYLGQETGTAVARVLTGEVNPSGKLPITVPRSVGQLPAYYYQKPSAKRGFLFADISPLFPFGHGLSYTTFAYDKLEVSPQRITPGQEVVVSVEVTNTGKVAGDEVVQLYLRDLVASVTRPVKLLKGFARVSLAPGQRRTVQLTLGPQAMALYDRDMSWVVEPGQFEVMVGGSSETVLSGTFEVGEE